MKIISPCNNETVMQKRTTTSIGWINVTVMTAEEPAIPICVSNPGAATAAAVAMGRGSVKLIVVVWVGDRF